MCSKFKLRKFIVCGWFAVACILSSTAFAQPRVTIDAEHETQPEFEIDHTRLAILGSTSCSHSIFTALEGSWVSTKEQFFQSDTRGCYWVRAKLYWEKPVELPSDVAMANTNWLVEAGHHGLNTVYIVEGGIVVDSLKMGNDLPLNQRAYPHVWSQTYLNIAALNLKYSQEYDLIFNYSNNKGQSLYGTNDRLAINLLPSTIVDADARLHLVFSGLMMGGLLLLFLYQLAQWAVYRTELGITYCFMLLGLMAFILYDDFLLAAIFGNRHVSEIWLFVTGSIGLLGFFRFAQLTLRAVNFNPLRNRVLGFLFKAKLVEVIVYLIFAVFENSIWSRQLGEYVPETFRILLMITLLIFSWVVIAHFRENKDSATRTFMFGNLSVVAGIMIVTTQVYILPFADLAPVYWYLSIIWPAFDYIIEAGIVGMSLCFATAVAMLTKERELSIERAFSRRLVDVEMKALRSQMNPHFLFNGLNSIKSFVIDNKRHEAADYLSKFSRLIRRVLENSKASLIPLSRELETLDYYLEMESMRFDGRFSYGIAVEEGVDAGAIQVPPTLIQPFVENSIWHGLLPKVDETGYVKIYVAASANAVFRIVVEDNGIGREASEIRRANLPLKRKSLGMEITAERIAMLKELYGFSAELEFVDLKNEFNVATGTRVVISISQIQQSLHREG